MDSRQGYVLSVLKRLWYFNLMKRDLEEYRKIENSIMREYRSRLWAPFIDALKTYSLLSPGDRIAVCISGGKDSMLLAVLMRMLQRISDFPFDLEYIVMDPGYSSETLAQVQMNLGLLGIEAEIFPSDIFSTLESAEKYPCYLCARMRRGWLYKKAQEKGCNKIALGHHMDDVIETVLMGMFYSSQLQNMPPKLRSRNYEGMELIRPLYRISEGDIIAWCSSNGLSFIRCACTVTKRNEEDGKGSKREEVKNLIKSMKKDNPHVAQSIFNSIHNVYISTFPGYRDGEEKVSFLRDYGDVEHV